MVRAQALRLRCRLADQLARLGFAAGLPPAFRRRRLSAATQFAGLCQCGGDRHGDVHRHCFAHHQGRLALALGRKGMTGLLPLAALAAIAAAPITAPGPLAPLAGTYLDAGRHAPVVLMIPGSGPTDRDGNSPLGLAASSYRLLAEVLATRGVSTVRIDKRGLGGSKAAVANGNAVTIADYAADTHSWVGSIRARTGAKCLWLLGHSEGALIALAAAQKPEGICGVILVSGAGRKLSDVIREQLRANPANAPVLDSAMTALDSLEHRQHVDVSAMHPALQKLFAPQVQDFLIDMFSYDPAKLAASTELPLLVVQGGRDLQVSVADAKALAVGKAKLRLLPQMNHVLKDVASDDRAANLATYTDSLLPVDSGAVDAIATFVKS